MWVIIVLAALAICALWFVPITALVFAGNLLLFHYSNLDPTAPAQVVVINRDDAGTFLVVSVGFAFALDVLWRRARRRRREAAELEGEAQKWAAMEDRVDDIRRTSRRP